ncbi:hypothetical protein BU17DRAFT_43611 [Hysterangium stoloniferum]|nr:hypothetical protein BU17DRAFT_43611 [Hysterangium stoloniferum]
MSKNIDELRSLRVEGSSEGTAGSSSSNVAPQQRLSFPKQLRRPPYRPISPEALSAIDPDLAEVPIEYIQDKLLASGDLLYAMTTQTTIQCPKDSLPRNLEVVMRDMSSGMPTHIAAVSCESPPHQKQRVILYPIHALVFAIQCARLPPMPCSHLPARREAEDNTVTLPVLSFVIPSPRTFALLVEYLYTHRTKNMLSALIPVPSYTSSPQELSQKLTQLCTVPALLSLISTAHGLWSNVAKLGVFDEKLWETIEFNWKVLLAALEIKTKNNATT